ncbi:MAG: GtrA family protein [Spirochaetes bacterium]|nr:GtrA family protein [Spirochaetota bacterium]
MYNPFIRFLIVGGFNTLFGYSIYAFIIFIGLHYSLAAFISTVLGILFSFKTTGLIVFQSHNNLLIFKYFGVYAVRYLLNVLGLIILCSYQINEYVGGAVLILPLGYLSFTLNKRFVFKTEKRVGIKRMADQYTRIDRV